MKKIFSILIAAVVVVVTATVPVLAQTEQTRQVSGFNGIAASSSFNVHVKINGTESVKVSADESIINDVETVVEGNTLNIRQKKGRQWNFRTGKVDVYVTAKSLSSLSSSGSGNVQLDGSLTGNVQLKASGSGNITAAVNGSDLHASVSGSGNITSSVNAGQVDLSVSGSGSMSLNGSAKNTNIQVSGSGDLRAASLKTDVLTANVAGSGSIRINVEKTITAHVSGSGDIVYTGNATNVDVRSSGSGRVRKG